MYAENDIVIGGTATVTISADGEYAQDLCALGGILVSPTVNKAIAVKSGENAETAAMLSVSLFAKQTVISVDINIAQYVYFETTDDVPASHIHEWSTTWSEEGYIINKLTVIDNKCNEFVLTDKGNS